MPAPISFKGQVTEHTTVKWSIDGDKGIKFLIESENRIAVPKTLSYVVPKVKGEDTTNHSRM